jgi:hypothetical protein
MFPGKPNMCSNYVVIKNLNSMNIPSLILNANSMPFAMLTDCLWAMILLLNLTSSQISPSSNSSLLMEIFIILLRSSFKCNSVVYHVLNPHKTFLALSLFQSQHSLIQVYIQQQHKMMLILCLY